MTLNDLVIGLFVSIVLVFIMLAVTTITIYVPALTKLSISGGKSILTSGTHSAAPQTAVLFRH